MHVETYALLGEAFLARDFPEEATELFQRALSGDPESLTSRLGLGLIYDQQGKRLEAIWQLERAFALAPGDPRVRRELGRMYADRDGAPSDRLRLTRDALGGLYARNGLFERAITEFRAVLRQDPDQPDIQVALVESLWHEGRRLEAVETCLSLLEQLPHCLKANLILGEIWLRAGHDDIAMEKLDTARALDPENLVAQEMMGSESPLPVEDVYLPELVITEEELRQLMARLTPAAAVTVAKEKPEAGEVPYWVKEMEAAEGPATEKAPPVEGAPEWPGEPALSDAVEAETPSPAAKAEIGEQRTRLQQQVETEPSNNQARLELARLCRADQDPDASLGHYEVLISDPELRPQVVEDLATLTKEDVDKPRVLQLLGDAHMQDNQLDRALEMYRQAHAALLKA
jgi:tetratricopeptide (TPR) repeat protein